MEYLTERFRSLGGKDKLLLLVSLVTLIIAVIVAIIWETISTPTEKWAALGAAGQIAAAVATAAAAIFAFRTVSNDEKRAQEDRQRAEEDRQRAEEDRQRAKEDRQRIEEDRQHAKHIRSLQMLMVLDEHFNGDRFLRIRSRAAEALLEIGNGKLPEWPNDDVVETQDVLNFFDRVAFLTDCGALDVHHVWNLYGPRICLYYTACKDGIEDVRSKRNSPWRYEQLEKLHKKLAEIQRQWHLERGGPPEGFNDGHLKHFLEREVKRGKQVELGGQVSRST